MILKPQQQHNQHLYLEQNSIKNQFATGYEHMLHLQQVKKLMAILKNQLSSTLPKSSTTDIIARWMDLIKSQSIHLISIKPQSIKKQGNLTTQTVVLQLKACAEQTVKLWYLLNHQPWPFDIESWQISQDKDSCLMEAKITIFFI